MDEASYLELPLERDLYRAKVCAKPKKPLHVLITEAGSKVAYNLMYEICSGKVFGPDQEVVLHLVNAKGAIDHKSSLLELEECGFHLLVDSVVHSEAEVAYNKVDIVVFIALFEELSGHSYASSFLSQIIKTRQVARNMRTYANPNAKLVVCGPSTKGVSLLLTSLPYFEPELNHANISSVILLDETIAKSLIASQLKTTTDKIKNIVMWGAIHPDIQNATVLMYHPDDKAMLEKVEVPLMEAVEDQKWLYTDFIGKLYRRTMTADLIRHGKAVASAIARHLKLLYYGSDNQEEIISMGTIVPSYRPYGLDKHIGFSLPVYIKDGVLTIREDVKYQVTTHLMNIRSVHNYAWDSLLMSIREMILAIVQQEHFTREDFVWSENEHLVRKYSKVFDPVAWAFKLVITPNPVERHFIKERKTNQKSITWDDFLFSERLNDPKIKSKSLLMLHSTKSQKMGHHTINYR